MYFCYYLVDTIQVVAAGGLTGVALSVAVVARGGWLDIAADVAAVVAAYMEGCIAVVDE